MLYEDDSAPERYTMQPTERDLKLTEDKLNFVTEHVIGVAKRFGEEMRKGERSLLRRSHQLVCTWL